jgi:hypothetical protein
MSECKRCGLETDGGYSHKNVDRCLDVTMAALRVERARTAKAVTREMKEKLAEALEEVRRWEREFGLADHALSAACEQLDAIREVLGDE